MLKNMGKVKLGEATTLKIEDKTLAQVKDVVLLWAFVLLTALSARFKIEIGPVPITMQTLFVLLSGAILGAKKGAFSQLLYLFFGLLGLPFFSRGGGLSYLFSPTFGYLIGFVFASFFVGWFFEKGFNKRIEKIFLIGILASVFIYLPGLFWLKGFICPKEVFCKKVLTVGLYPFILGDLFKILLFTLILKAKERLI
jgi:biotin transporter BioY